jgi:hypothetical protein
MPLSHYCWSVSLMLLLCVYLKYHYRSFQDTFATTKSDPLNGNWVYTDLNGYRKDRMPGNTITSFFARVNRICVSASSVRPNLPARQLPRVVVAHLVGVVEKVSEVDCGNGPSSNRSATGFDSRTCSTAEAFSRAKAKGNGLIVPGNDQSPSRMNCILIPFKVYIDRDCSIPPTV